MAVVKWCGTYVADKIDESERSLKILIEPLAHKLGNVGQRVDQIERLRVGDIERIVKLETNLSNLDKGQVRIENTLDSMKREAAQARAEIIESIREIREVKSGA